MTTSPSPRTHLLFKRQRAAASQRVSVSHFTLALLCTLVPGCLVYDSALLTGNGDTSSGGSASTGGGTALPATGGMGGQPPTGGTGGTSPENTGGSAPNPTGGTTGTGGKPAEECNWDRATAILTSEPVDPIDVFDDGDNLIPKVNGRSGAWYSINDASGGTQIPSTGGWNGVVMPFVDMSDSNRALHYRGYGFKGSGNGDGWHLFATNLADGAEHDLSMYDGLALWVRADCALPGSEQALLRVAISDAASQPSMGAIDHAGTSLTFELTHRWQQVKLPFAKFSRRFGVAGVFDPSGAIAVYFSPRTEGALDIWVDDLVLYSDE